MIYLWTLLPSKWHWKDEARSKNIHFAGRTTWLSPKLATWERGGVKFTRFQFGVNSSDCKQQSNYNQISLTSCTDCSICPGISFNNIREGISKRWLDQHSKSDIFMISGPTFKQLLVFSTTKPRPQRSRRFLTKGCWLVGSCYDSKKKRFIRKAFRMAVQLFCLHIWAI